MADKIGDAFVEIGVKDAKLGKGLEKGGKQLARFGNRSTAASGKFTHSVAKMRTAIGLLKFAMIGLVAGGAIKSLFTAFVEQERQTAKLNAVLKATGNAAGFSSRELQDMASELQNVTGVGDEVILSLQSIVGTFKAIKGDEFAKVTENILDLSIVMETDAKGAALQLAKALNDPIKGVTALNKAGVDFNQTEREQLKLLAESGKMMEAQRIILAKVEGQVGGTARAMRDTFGGSLDAVSNSFGDVQEGLGELIVEFLNLEEANNDVADSFTTTEKKLKDLANSPAFIAFSERLRGSFARGVLEVQMFAETFGLMGEILGRTLFNIGQNVNSMGKVIGRSLANIINDTDFNVGEVLNKTESATELFMAKFEENAKRRDAFDEVFRTRLAARLKKHTDEMIVEEEKGKNKVVDAENKKRKARDQSLSSFADIIKEAQKAASVGVGAPGAFGGGAQNANPPGTTTSDKVTTTRDQSLDVLLEMLLQLKLITTNTSKFAVFG